MEKKILFFELKEVVFIALIAAALTVSGFLVVPLVIAIPIPGIRSIPPAVFYGFFMCIGLLKTRKPGTITIIAILNGLVLLMMSYLMFLNNLVAALVTEVVVFGVFRSYRSNAAIVTAATLYMPLTIPANVLVTYLLGGEVMGRFFSQPFVLVLILVITALLSFVGSMAAIKLGNELIRAGKFNAPVVEP